jgi:hypothetical protein
MEQYTSEELLQLSGNTQYVALLRPFTNMSHPEVLQDTVSVRLETIHDADVLLLRLDAGGRFSGPGTFVQLRQLEPGSPEQAAQIEATLKQWREQDRLPFPNFGADGIAEMKDSLDYPPKGSPA